jgi:RNA polymerase sigma factor (sigma-70 family)
MPIDAPELTSLLRRWSAGDAAAFDQLAPLVYDRLRQIAHHRRRAARDGAATPVELDALAPLDDTDVDRIEALHEALERLEALDPRQAAIVAMRCFGGLSLEETADALGVSLSTVHRELRSARAWLGTILADEPAR